jgi:nitrous oxide reductase accessory protein NosL
MQLNLGSKFDSATATTLLEHRTVPAQDAWYVYKSGVVTDMSPGFIAFLTEDQARRFVNGYGGKVVNFTQAMDIVKNGFQ